MRYKYPWNLENILTKIHSISICIVKIISLTKPWGSPPRLRWYDECLLEIWVPCLFALVLFAVLLLCQIMVFLAVNNISFLVLTLLVLSLSEIRAYSMHFLTYFWLQHTPAKYPVVVPFSFFFLHLFFTLITTFSSAEEENGGGKGKFIGFVSRTCKFGSALWFYSLLPSRPDSFKSSWVSGATHLDFVMQSSLYTLSTCSFTAR